MYKSFTKELKTSPFSGEILEEDLEKYSTDESIFYIKPKLVVIPNSQEDVSILVRLANKFEGIHLTARSAGTGLSGGSLNDGVIVDLTRLNKIHRLVKKDKEGEVVLEAGVYYGDLEKKMDKRNLFLPSYPASKNVCTVGGMVGNNSAGSYSFHYGQTADYVKSLKVVLADGNLYEIFPVDYDGMQKIISQKGLLSDIYKFVFETLEKRQGEINEAKPKTTKNTSGFAIWDVLDGEVDEFKKGEINLDLTKLLTGSQGTLGIITEIKLMLVEKPKITKLVCVPLFSISEISEVVKAFADKSPLNMEVFDGPTLKAAFKNPFFFFRFLSFPKWCLFIVKLYSLLPRFNFQLPKFIFLISFDEKAAKLDDIKYDFFESKGGAETEMLWQVRQMSYPLSKLTDKNKRPAAFLEDIIVRPEHLTEFIRAINALFHKYEIKAFVHGHGGDGHLHFYPMLDFTKKQTKDIIIKMIDEFFSVAIKYQGSICGEHNDGVIRTPYLSMMFGENMLNLFGDIEKVFDAENIFNPGKKTNHKFEISKHIRNKN